MKTLLRNIKSFIKQMLSGSDETSHKRVISLASFFVLVVMVLLKAKGYQVDENLIYCFAALCGGQSLLSVIDKFTNKPKAF